jgi:hypothetical protein
MPRKVVVTEELNELLRQLLPPDEVYETMVSPEDQAERLGVVRKNLSPESFFFVFNLLTCELEAVAGVDMALGYPDREFTVGQYMSSVHPGQSIQFNMIARSMYKVLCKGVFKLHFIIDSYISLVALRHYNGEYLVFKKTTSVFQYDRKNRLLAQLNEFTKVDVYEHSPLKPRIQEMGGLQKNDFETAVFRMTFQSFAEKKYFSGRELEVLRAYAGQEDITTKGLAELLQVEVSTINTYNKRILEKAKEIFTHPFVEAREVALYLKKERIL